MRYSLLENFWPAIHFGEVSFSVDSQEINSVSLNEALKEFKGDDNFSAAQYYNVLTSPELQLEEDIGRLGRVKLFLKSGNNFNKRISFIRKNSMIIQHKLFRGIKGFAGVFICDNDIGNEFLRALEPPRHDKWDPKRKRGGKTVLDSLYKWIRTGIRDLMPKPSNKSFELDDLGKYLPEYNDDMLSNDDGDNKDETLIKVPATVISTIDHPKKKKSKKTVPSGGLKSPDNGTEGDDPESGGTGKGSGDATPKVPSGGDEGGNDDSRESTGPGVVAEYVNMRAFMPSKTEYTLVFRSDKDFDGKYYLYTAGEDGTKEAPIEVDELLSASCDAVINEGRIFLNIKQGEVAKLKVKLSKNQRVSIKGVAYEN